MRATLPVLLVLAGTAMLTTSLASCAPSDPSGALPLLKTFVDDLVSITPGEGKFPATFRMGSASGPAEEQPVREVRMAVPFAIARYEVPQNLYEAVMGFNPSRWKGPRNSAEMMTFNQAREFCEKLTVLLREAKLIGEDELIRLPTEAEWEYCCRAGTDTSYSFGEHAQAEGDAGVKASLLDNYAWHTGNAAGNDPPVGALAPNPWGLYDMHGYLWEFCEDSWHADYTQAPNVSYPAWREEGARLCVVRGGSWKESFEHHRSASRRASPVTVRDDALGFRCVRAKVAR